MFVLIGFTRPAIAQNASPDTLEVALPEITVDAVRSTETAASAPYAVSVRALDAEELALKPTRSLETVLRALPGIWISDRGHFALGESISIRGMGARAAFGVRGIQVLLDGIPLTMPDGQSTLDVVEPSTLRQVELLRSPASLFWGNGSGGVLFLSSASRPSEPTLRFKGFGGAYGQRELLAEGAVPFGAHHVRGYASHLTQDGFRNYSEGSQTRLGGTGRFFVGSQTLIRAVAAAAIQDTEHPGSLTADEVAADPRSARPGNPETNSGKESTHVQTGITIEHERGSALVTGTAYGVRRLLENPLPFAYIDLDRTAGGLRTSIQIRQGRLQWGFGADAGIQHDIRKNWNNESGTPGDDLGLDQIEDVVSTGAFGYARYVVLPNMQVTGGVRRSVVNFEMDDRLVANGDESGDRRFSAWSPSVGMSYRAGSALFFANYGTAFETPTTTELVNRPDMTGGFNEDLDPQLSKGIEVGARGALPSGRLDFDVAAFYVKVDGRLVSFTNDLGREFFRNAGKNTHRGIEAAFHWRPAGALELTGSYTGARYVFDESDLDGNALPGVPEHRLFVGIEANRSRFWLKTEIEAVSEYFVDDQNTTSNDAYAVVDLYAGHQGLRAGPADIKPFISLRNVLDAEYSGTVVVNAAGGRFYEPSPGRALLAGLQITL
jgi:iron complex outermembrane receptor protein